MFGEPPPKDFEEWVDWLIGLIGRYPDNIMIGEMGYVQMIQHVLLAREKVPSSGAHWEIAAFFGPAVAATVALLAHGRVESYPHFRQLASAIFGWEVRPLSRLCLPPVRCIQAWTASGRNGSRPA